MRREGSGETTDHNRYANELLYGKLCEGTPL